MKLTENIKKIRGIGSEAQVLARAYLDSRTPVTTKLAIAILILLYIASPIDILPDVLPLLGITDDILVIPMLMWILLPNNTLNDARTYVAKMHGNNPKNHHWIWWTVGIILLVGILYLGVLMYLLRNEF